MKTGISFLKMGLLALAVMALATLMLGVSQANAAPAPEGSNTPLLIDLTQLIAKQ